MIAIGRGIHGRGVFAQRPFVAGELIERAPVLVIPAAEIEWLDRTMLYDYYFAWGQDPENAAIAMGLGSFYNHAVQPNAEHVCHISELSIDFIALVDIAAGEEITIHYNASPGDASPVWFEVPRP
ncbi:MAG: SET domain-containing protein [Polyangiaceae bacterium]|nr:SET domain-containing protein [Polyangiaceae bacterium]